MKSVGERIRQAREHLGMSGQELAQKVGYKHQSAIGNLENRATGSGGRRIAEIANALRVPVQWLLQGPDTDSLDQVITWPPADSASNAVHAVSEPASPYETGLRHRAISLVSRLPAAQLGEAIGFLEYLHSNRPAPISTNGAGYPVPAPKASA